MYGSGLQAATWFVPESAVERTRKISQSRPEYVLVLSYFQRASHELDLLFAPRSPADTKSNKSNGFGIRWRGLGTAVLRPDNFAWILVQIKPIGNNENYHTIALISPVKTVPCIEFRCQNILNSMSFHITSLFLSRLTMVDSCLTPCYEEGEEADLIRKALN